MSDETPPGRWLISLEVGNLDYVIISLLEVEPGQIMSSATTLMIVAHGFIGCDCQSLRKR
ncbi:hypothetical protein CVS30_16895 [Arthrobacter psychrolactophilus]|uniref:Uncharacterized protein n=1 Tax=Arthrobacter psychrolactophilus TaxID=92442 RepID=A0A2V5IKJ0_9MICC|nr:hypothetical protein [Arthrobacter psychrolactophilus]PYI37125.1 hypothetical protein CVS30_16895 [Arthrobacter psychrolactophilus]